MPSDIRSFFGGKPVGASQEQREPKTSSKSNGSKSGRKSRKVLDDSEDEEDKPLPKPRTPAKPAAKKREPSPEGIAMTTSDYFGNRKPTRSNPAQKSSKSPEKPGGHAVPKASPAKSTRNQPSPSSARSTPNTRTSSRRKANINYNEDNLNGSGTIKDEEDGKDDIFASEYNHTKRGAGDDYEEDNEIEEEIPRPVRKTVKKGISKNSERDDDDFEPSDIKMKDAEEGLAVSDEDIKIERPKRKEASSSNTGKKRKSPDNDVKLSTPKKAKKDTPKSTPRKRDDGPENEAMQDIFDNIPLVRPPTPPAANGEEKKWKFGASHANSGPAPAAGSVEIPTGAENCLAGLSFVFTGLLQVLSREEGQQLVKRYGGKVMSAPSSKTSYVVLGSDAGPKKLQVIKDNGLKTINENGLFELIRRLPANGGDSKAAAKYEEKQQAEMAKIQQAAEEAEREDRRVAGAGGKGINGKSTGKGSATGPDTRLWTVKHAPTQLNHICGNKAQVERLQRWLKNFPKNLRTNFKMAGADGSGIYRAVIISGPPGIGKTTAAHLVAKLEGYDIVETNASDTRSKKLVDTGLKGVLDTTSLNGYFAAGSQQVQSTKKKLALIMDEVDGMSAGDRGGVGALATMCKKSRIPLILICNDRKLPKMRPFDHVAYDLPFRRPTVDQIRGRIMTIGFRENFKLPPNVIDALIEGSGADIRQVVNMISTAKLDSEAEGAANLDFDRGKQMSKAWQKHTILRPWDIAGKIMNGSMFAATSKATLNEKIELYFNDHEFSYLMLQENYLGTTPLPVNNYGGRERNLKHLEMIEKAANSISEGDLVDRLIHGPEQHWSLMPTHAVFSFVRPASFIAGSMAGNQTRFTSWLGRNSSQGKLMRQVKEIQGHMRLRTSADRHEIRQQYVPMLWFRLIKQLSLKGKEAVPEAIDFMDSYYLTKDDYDSIMELGVGDMDQENIKLETQTKATFTRLYNAQSHPMPFIKASNVLQPKALTKEKPDLEEALDIEEEEAEVAGDAPGSADEDGEGEEGGEIDLSKDKYVKQPKKKKGKQAAKKTTATDENGQSDQEDSAPKNAKGKGKAKAKGKGKK